MSGTRSAERYAPRSGDGKRRPGACTPTRARRTGAALACLIPCLVSCATSPGPPVAPEVIRLTVPRSLTEPTEIPPVMGRTNGALIEWAIECVAAVRDANADKAAIRALGE